MAVHPRWLRAVSPLAARLSAGVRTAGAAKGGRQEYYGVTDLHRIDSASVSWDGGDAGPLAAIRPAVTFGFSSVPPEPSLARVRTTVFRPAPESGPTGPQMPSVQSTASRREPRRTQIIDSSHELDSICQWFTNHENAFRFAFGPPGISPAGLHTSSGRSAVPG